MGIPLAGAQMAELMKIYRDAWKAAGHPGHGRVMLAFHMFCAETREKAAAIAREPLNIYLRSIVNAASDWMSGVASKDYPNYQKMIEIISKETFESQVEKGSAWIGTPDDIRKSIAAYDSAGRRLRIRLAAGEFWYDPLCRGRAIDETVRTRSDAAFQALKEARMSVAAAAAARASLSGRDIPTLDSLYEAAGGVNFTPGWVPRKKPILWSEPRPEFVPAHWTYEDAKAGLDAAGRLIDVSLAERRNLVMRNPAPGRRVRDQPHPGLRLSDDPARRARALAPAFVACAARHHRRQGLVLDGRRREDADGNRRRGAHARLVLARPRP